VTVNRESLVWLRQVKFPLLGLTKQSRILVPRAGRLTAEVPLDGTRRWSGQWRVAYRAAFDLEELNRNRMAALNRSVQLFDRRLCGVAQSGLGEHSGPSLNLSSEFFPAKA
jgi:hypothetical protein